MSNTPHHLQLITSDLHVLFGCNWAAQQGRQSPLYLEECRKRGAKVIVIDPWLSQTSQMVA